MDTRIQFRVDDEIKRLAQQIPLCHPSCPVGVFA